MHIAKATESQPNSPAPRSNVFRALGLGLITGAADDDPSAIGTYASAGAKFGFSFLWMAPMTFPMMFTVVYLSSKLGQVTGKGLFEVIRNYYPRWILYSALIGVLIGNTIEAAADIAGMAAALELLAPIPMTWIVVGITLIILILQIFGSYTLIRNTFRWLALALLAYVGSAILARPELRPTLQGTLIPSVRFDREFLTLVVAVIGTSLSAYLYTWQSNQEVEEKIANGRGQMSERRGATHRELHQSRVDIQFGMLFSNAVMYFVMLSTAATLFTAGRTDIKTAAEAAQALRPLAGNAAEVLFALGIIGSGFLAVPVMTTGVAYDLCQTLSWPGSLHARPSEAKHFYAVIVVVTLVAMGINFLGINPIRALVFAGIVQGFSTPPLMLLMMLMTNNRTIMGKYVNGRRMNIVGWITTGAIFAASLGLVMSWFA